MFKRLLSLEWKAFYRSASLGKSIGLKILMIFLAFYFVTIFLLAGIGLYPLILKYVPGEEPLMVVNGYIFLYLIIELILRFFLQPLPVLDIKPLLSLPVKKRTVIDFVLFKSIFSFFNFLPLLLILPFGFFNISASSFSTSAIISWMVGVYGLSLCINMVNFIIKKRFNENVKALRPWIGVFLIIALFDYSGIFKITYWFANLVDLFPANPIFGVLPWFLFLGLLVYNRIGLKNKFYLDAGLKARVKSINTREFLWTRWFGDLAPYLQQDLKLIWRNKRPKTSIYLSILLLGYGLIFYQNEMYQGMPTLFVFAGIFMTGIFMINFGQFIPAWDAGYYPLIMAQNISLEKYLTAKAILVSFSIAGLAILTTPYLYYGWNIFLLNIVCAVYNIGVNIPILLYAGSFNRKRIDLDKSPLMNYQGTGAAQWLVSIPLILIPVVLFWVASQLFSFEGAVGVLFIFGMAGLILRDQLISLIAQVYKRNKYAMIQGFKEKSE